MAQCKRSLNKKRKQKFETLAICIVSFFVFVLEQNEKNILLVCPLRS